jgi:hypothetical protein
LSVLCPQAARCTGGRWITEHEFCLLRVVSALVCAPAR